MRNWWDYLKRDSFPAGFRFHPTDEELVDYLKRKMEAEVFEDSDIIPEIDVCQYDPWNLPELDSSCNAMELFFFSPLDYKSTNSIRLNRRTPSGSWKPTGKPQMIKDRRSNAVIGIKTILTFQPKAKKTEPIAKKPKPTPSKTNWVMHQYDRMENSNPELVQRDFLLCRVKQKSDKDTSVCDEGERCSYNVPNHEYQAAAPEYYASSAQQSLEPGVLLQANDINNDCTKMRLPFGDNNHFVTDTNDISTCGEGDLSITVSDFQNEAAYDMFSEPYHGHDYCSSISQSPFGDNNHFVTNKNDISTCDEGGSHSITVSDFQNKAAYDMFPESPESKVLMQANDINNDCTKMRSPFGDNNHFVTDTNDISTCGEGDLSITVFDFQNEVAYDMFQELYHGNDFCSSTSQSPLYTNHGNVPHGSVHNQECNMQKSTFCDNRSIIYDELDNNTAEVRPQPENLALVFCPPQVQDNTLLPPLVNTNEGDVLLDSNYIVCNEYYSPIWSM